MPARPRLCIVAGVRNGETCTASMRIYLDNCCFNRPFDDQGQVRVRLETEAKLAIQQDVSDGELDLAWSYVLDLENASNPFEERREAVSEWKPKAVADAEGNAQLLGTARALEKRGLRPKGTLHVACAIDCGCAYFITTDDRLVKAMHGFPEIAVVNPVQFVVESEGR